MSSPAAEVEVGEDLVRALLAGQHADLADRPLSHLDAGWDNELWRLGDDLLVRLPRRKLAAPLILNEQRWLPTLADRLPLQIPAPVRIGRPTDLYPWYWSVVPWLDGRPADGVAIADPSDAARRLGRFLRTLHHAAPPDAPHNPWRGVPLIARTDTFEQRLAGLAPSVDVIAIRRAWRAAIAAVPHPGPPLWLHADLHPANLLVAGGTLSAVIDFGDLCAGDPSTDVASVWMLLSPAEVPVFAEAYGGVDTDLLRRSMGWALLFGLMLVEIGQRERPTYGRIGRATLERVAGFGLAD